MNRNGTLYHMVQGGTWQAGRSLPERTDTRSVRAGYNFELNLLRFGESQLHFELLTLNS